MEQEIIFLEADCPKTIAKKTFDIFVGTSELKPKLGKLGITYTKSYRGLHTYYYLKGKGLDGTLAIRL